MTKKTVDQWLDEVDYHLINNGKYKPSEFALRFMNFVKLVNGEAGEANKTPNVHLMMLDKLASPSRHIANLCFRGAAKTTLFFEYFVLYCAVFCFLEGFGRVYGMIYVSDSMDNGVASAKKNIEHRYESSEFLKEWLPFAKFTINMLEFRNKAGQKFGVKMFGAKSGVRGTKIYGRRPCIAVLDDLIDNEDAKSPVSMAKIKDTIYKDVFPALDPNRRKIIFNGTPFHSEDVIIGAVESGAWEVNVWPVCEKFPCSREDFNGAWEDRFSYDFVLEQYEMAVKTGNPAAFYQEYMLRITSEDERIIQEADINWFDRKHVLTNKHNYNFYITTDFATTARTTSDFNVISVWAYSKEGEWLWVDGIHKKQTIDKTIDDLFRLVQEYQPFEVAIETSGQQGAFIDLLRKEQMTREIWFNFSGNRGAAGPRGIMPTKDKLSRFMMVVPLFKAYKILFPEEWKTTPIMGACMQQLRLVTVDGIKGKDDFLDTISQLAHVKAIKPTEYSTIDAQASAEHDRNYWSLKRANSATNSSYIV